PRCEPFSFTRFKALYLPVTRHGRTFVSGSRNDGVWRMEWLRVLPPIVPYAREGAIQGPERPQYVSRLGSGHTLVNVEELTDYGTDRLVELDRLGRVVWESYYANVVGGLLVCPMVRFGFERFGEGVVDLDTEPARIRLLRHPNVLLRRQASDW